MSLLKLYVLPGNGRSEGVGHDPAWLASCFDPASCDASFPPAATRTTRGSCGLLLPVKSKGREPFAVLYRARGLVRDNDLANLGAEGVAAIV
jgi:hypothetical protein